MDCASIPPVLSFLSRAGSHFRLMMLIGMGCGVCRSDEGDEFLCLLSTDCCLPSPTAFFPSPQGFCWRLPPLLTFDSFPPLVFCFLPHSRLRRRRKTIPLFPSDGSGSVHIRHLCSDRRTIMLLPPTHRIEQYPQS